MRLPHLTEHKDKFAHKNGFFGERSPVIFPATDDPTTPCVSLPLIMITFDERFRLLFFVGSMTMATFNVIDLRDELQLKHRSEHIAQKLLLQLSRAVEEGNWS